MTIKRVILHLGMAKAGSSSIQHTLLNNTPILEKNGFRYLTEWGVNHLYTFHNLFSEPTVFPIGTGNLGKPPFYKRRKNKKAINTMLQVMKNTTCETLILSGEYFAELWLDSTIKNIKKFIHRYFESHGIETTIIYFVRNPIPWLVSSLQQQVYTKGFMNKNGDFFEIRMKQYEGFLNLQKHFSDSLILLKFEDACQDEYGIAGCFFRKINFPDAEIANINFIRKNESRSIESMEFIHYIESVDPRYPYAHYRRFNANRSLKDLQHLLDIRGIKFDLPYESKVELWNRFKNVVNLLKESAGIDYTNYEIPKISENQEMYSEQTIQDFIEAFPKLSFVLQKHFIKFFEKKYMETTQVRFKQLHFKDSIPWKIFNRKNVFFSLLRLRLKNKILEILPYKIRIRLIRRLGD